VPRRSNSFQVRLARVMDLGNLRVADVARWFGRRHSTVRGWVVDGREPAGTAADVRGLFQRLNELQELVRASRKVTSTELRASIRSQPRA
jgi:hypothetical protein